MIINGKHVVYDGTLSTLDEVLQVSISRSRQYMINAVLKTNLFVDYMFAGEKRRLEQYYEGTINADLIHDWQREENIYHG